MPIQLIGGKWPDDWAPANAGTLEHEPFDIWWPRVAQEFRHLDPRVPQQWVHRHWNLSPYFGFDLGRVTSSLRRLSTSMMIIDVWSVDNRRPRDIEHPEDTYERFNLAGIAKYEPALTMNATGTWDMPVVILESSDGFSYGDALYLEARYWLVEGHLRQRYLRALAHKRRAAAEHEVLLLKVVE